MENLTRVFRKKKNLFNKGNFNFIESLNLKSLGSFMLFLISIVIASISAKILVVFPMQNYEFLISQVIIFVELLICCGILIFISKKENPMVNTRQKFLIIGLLLVFQIININFEEISPLAIIVPAALIISQGVGTLTALSWIAIACINWSNSGSYINNSLLLITFTSSCIVAILGGKIRSRAQLLQISILIPLGAFISQSILLGVNKKDDSFNNIQDLIQNPGDIFSDSFLLATLMLLVIIMMPILESIFGLLTKARLLELADKEKPLLRRLSIEAPGTFEHTLLICGLAEEATRMIDGDVDLIKTGALYHDIGKLHAPNWFIENQNGKENPHDELDNPLESAKILQDHVDKGLQFARKYRLPKEIANFIPEHQGTLKMGYFLFKAREKNNDVSEKDFKYNGPIPQSKETAILMLADGCEAALRAMNINATDTEAINTISKIINSRIKDGQLSDSNLSIAEIFLIKRSFLNVWKRIRHRRIQYPTIKNNTFS